jgi:membrane protease subunit HflC
MLTRILLVVVLAIAGLSMSLFRVFEAEKVILFQLGEIKRADYEPGLHFMIPFYQNVAALPDR